MRPVCPFLWMSDPQKAFRFRGGGALYPDLLTMGSGTLPLDPAGGSAPYPSYRLALGVRHGQGPYTFYRVMHYSAKRGLAIKCRLSVCPSVCLSVRLSVTLVDHDHLGWTSWKLIAQTISPTSSFFIAQRPSTYSQGYMEKFWGDYRKSGVLEHKSRNIS